MANDKLLTRFTRQSFLPTTKNTGSGHKSRSREESATAVYFNAISAGTTKRKAMSWSGSCNVLT